MTTVEFIEALAEQQIVDAELARQLKQKATEDGARVSPEAILKFLVKTDVITEWKGEELAAMMLAAAYRALIAQAIQRRRIVESGRLGREQRFHARDSEGFCGARRRA